ncbi:hypothetical protein [Streptomyces clavuligerus]|uniref:hypothetical protein n=1 Tax=Streptomyces clavuligerus TaxID=1901 RepID=UPI0018D004D6|nr:hypothetical protein [Streptomyces clavuligerus]WDN56241.1 hypothetical protein LL058_30810 [Streptomyces clavuligerus]
MTTFTTPAGRTYAYTVETGENGETVYDLSAVYDVATFPIGTVVVHPNWELDPVVPGLLNIQFGKGSIDRHERTDVPMLGEGTMPYVVGSHLVNPADLVPDPETEDKNAVLLLNFRKKILGAAYQTSAPAERATKATYDKVQDLTTALVTVYQNDKNTPKREATYAAFLNTQRAEKIQPQIDHIDQQIKTLQITRAELTHKANSYKTT